MKNILIGLIIGYTTSLIAGELSLTNEQKLKAENLQLKIALTQCQVSINSNNLTSERQKLIEEFRSSLQAKPDQEFDWSLLSFKQSEEKKK